MAHKDNTRFICCYCSAEFKSNTERYRHYSICVKRPMSCKNNTPFRCCYCLTEFKTNTKRYRHYSVCEKRPPKNNSARQNKLTDTIIKKQETKRESECNKCQKQYSKKQWYLNHKKHALFRYVQFVKKLLQKISKNICCIVANICATNVH